MLSELDRVLYTGVLTASEWVLVDLKALCYLKVDWANSALLDDVNNEETSLTPTARVTTCRPIININKWDEFAYRGQQQYSYLLTSFNFG